MTDKYCDVCRYYDGVIPSMRATCKKTGTVTYAWWICDDYDPREEVDLISK